MNSFSSQALAHHAFQVKILRGDMDGRVWAQLRAYVVFYSVEEGLGHVWNQQILPRSACLEEAKETQGCVQKVDENPQVFFVVQCKILELIAQCQEG